MDSDCVCDPVWLGLMDPVRVLEGDRVELGVREGGTRAYDKE